MSCHDLISDEEIKKIYNKKLDKWEKYENI